MLLQEGETREFRFQKTGAAAGLRLETGKTSFSSTVRETYQRAYLVHMYVFTGL